MAYDKTTVAYQSQAYALAANGTLDIYLPSAAIVRILDVIGSGTLAVGFQDEQPTQSSAGIGFKAPVDPVTGQVQPFTKMTIKEIGGLALTTVRIAYSSGEILDSRLSVSGTLNVNLAASSVAQTVSNVTGAAIRTWSGATMSAPSNISVTTASTTLLASSTTRRRAWIQSLDTNTVDVFVSGGTATTNGLQLKPGQTMLFENGAAIAGIVSSGTANVRVLGESD